MQHAEDDRQNARPRTELEEAEAADDPRQRENDEKHGNSEADRSADEHRLPLAGDRARPNHDGADANPYQSDHGVIDDEAPSHGLHLLLHAITFL